MSELDSLRAAWRDAEHPPDGETAAYHLIPALEAEVERLRAVRRALVRDNRDKTNTIRELQARVDELQEELHATDIARLSADGPH